MWRAMRCLSGPRPTRPETGMHDAAQLTLLEPAPAPPMAWRLEGRACTRCDEGRMVMARASDPCVCVESVCLCLAEGYAVCDACGTLAQVWPRDMVQAPR